MKRDDALSLLRELMLVCETLRYAPIVTLNHNSADWELRVKWTSDGEEKDCFAKTIEDRGLSFTETSDGFTIFHA